jgi:hypothetical protein
MVSVILWFFSTIIALLYAAENNGSTPIQELSAVASVPRPAFVFPFLRNGTEFLLEGCKDYVCACDVNLEWYVPDAPGFSGAQDFDIISDAHGDVLIARFSMSAGNWANLVYRHNMNQGNVFLLLNISVVLVSSGQVVFNGIYHMVLLHPSDIGIQDNDDGVVVQSTELGNYHPIIDFIEIGTSNWDTCAQAAEQMLVSGSASHIRGTSVDIMLPYLQELPVFPGLTKVHGAITADPTKEMVSVFYVSPSIIDRVSIYH